MNWFNNLLNAANDFAKTPLANSLIGKSTTPTTAPIVTAPTKNGLPTWVWPVGIGAAILVVVMVIFRKKRTGL